MDTPSSEEEDINGTKIVTEKGEWDGKEGGNGLTTITQSVTKPEIKIILKEYFITKAQVHSHHEKTNDLHWKTLFKEISRNIEP